MIDTASSPATGTNGHQDGGDLRAKASDAADQARERAQGLAENARGRARSMVDERTTQAGERVDATASDLRTVGDELRAQGKEQPAKLADQAAERAERFGAYLKDADPDRLLHDIEDFGRRQPWALAAAGLVFGLAAARLVKASSSERYAARGYTGNDSAAEGYAPAADGYATEPGESTTPRGARTEAY